MNFKKLLSLFLCVVLLALCVPPAGLAASADTAENGIAVSTAAAHESGCPTTLFNTANLSAAEKETAAVTPADACDYTNTYNAAAQASICTTTGCEYGITNSAHAGGTATAENQAICMAYGGLAEGVRYGITASADTVKPGETVTVSLKIPAAGELVASVSLGFSFNHSVFTLTDYNLPDISGTTKAVQDTQKSAVLTAANSFGSFYNGYASNDSEASAVWPEVTATFTFTAKTDAAAGSYRFEIGDWEICSLDDDGFPVTVLDLASLSAEEKEAVVAVVTAHTHSYQTITVPASCICTGREILCCTECGYSEVISETGYAEHRFETLQTVAPTCEDGYDLCRCTVCGIIVQQNITSGGHRNTFVETVAPTCTDYGYNVYYCEVCGQYNYADYVNPPGHDFADTVVAPTCTEDGYTLHRCTHCPYEYSDTPVEKLGHIGIHTRLVAATCLTDGYAECYCARCAAEYNEVTVAKTGHVYVDGVCIMCRLGEHEQPQDLDGSGVIDDGDAAAVQQCLLNETACDLNGDGKSDIRDFVRMKKLLAQ